MQQPVDKRPEEKDKFYIDVLGETLAYEVDKIDVVLPEDTDCIVTDSNEDYVTLITCTPYMINTHRLLVRGSRIELEEEEKQEKIQKSNIEDISSKRKINIIISIVSFIIITIVLMMYIFKGGKKKTKKGG